MDSKISVLINTNTLLRNRLKFPTASRRKGNDNLHFPMKLKTSLL